MADYTVIGVYEESGQIIADAVKAKTGEQAITKAMAGKIEDGSVRYWRKQREGCRYIAAFRTGPEITYND